MVYNLQYMYANFEYVMGSMSFVFLITIPVLTMRVLAEEKRQKTDQLLYSLPISMAQVVCGKYAAMLVMLLIPVGIICLYPLILSTYGNMYLPAGYSAICGFFFLGASLIAIGTYISSVTENQAFAAGLCFVIMLLIYYVSDLAAFVPATAGASLIAFSMLGLLFGLVVYLMTKNTYAALFTTLIIEAGLLIVYLIDASLYEGLFSQVMTHLSVFDRFYVFVNGVFDLKAIVYFISVIGLFLFLSVQSMEKRRWSE
jgi:ABC-2 type transport system permease protein